MVAVAVRLWARVVAGCAFALAVSACATTRTGPSDAEAMAASLAGVYDNAVQWSQLPDSFRASAGLRAVEVRFVTVRPTQLKRVGVYEEWRSAEAGRPILNQRLWLFQPEGQAVRADRFEFTQPNRFIGAGADAFLSLTEADLTPLGPGCALRATLPQAQSWDASTTPRACRAQGSEPIETRVTKVPTGLLYAQSQSDSDARATPYDLRRR